MDYWLDGGWEQGGVLKECPQSIFPWSYLNGNWLLKDIKKSAVNFFLIMKELISPRVVKGVVPPQAHG